MSEAPKKRKAPAEWKISKAIEELRKLDDELDDEIIRCADLARAAAEIKARNSFRLRRAKILLHVPAEVRDFVEEKAAEQEPDADDCRPPLGRGDVSEILPGWQPAHGEDAADGDVEPGSGNGFINDNIRFVSSDNNDQLDDSVGLIVTPQVAAGKSGK